MKTNQTISEVVQCLTGKGYSVMFNIGCGYLEWGGLPVCLDECSVDQVIFADDRYSKKSITIFAITLKNKGIRGILITE